MDRLNEREPRLRQVGVGGEEGGELGDDLLKEASTRSLDVRVVTRLHRVNLAHHCQR